MAKKVVYHSDKGGVGKTTTATNQASMLKNRGITVAILKTDRNADVLSWREKRIANGLTDIPVFEAYGNDVAKEIMQLDKFFSVVLVDCAGHDSTEFRSAASVADILLTCVKPSSAFERETLTTLSETINKARIHNPKLVARVVMTRVKPNKLSDAVSLHNELCSDEAFVQPLKTRISEIDCFEAACNEGAGVHDLLRASSLGKAKAQIELLSQEIGII
ncbi:peptidyl-arginine deiminase (plasmid) [Candidatus Symbiopectobacterium sp. 'North America']|uniref:ParA family protein n=1 Tax=Candidatus Symbiopectobacterium sp. 'North America' TaxID=2794574 RepID=UPI0018C8DE8F|nr:ParA family protein [Candidatus Symbiopectobacterium sp. 'North America']MBG6246639.1 peptidyl-arginine deiminase [Candidatus Symbiopectobacterium sp. 'North America']